MEKKGLPLMRTSRDRRESRQLDLYPQVQACRACQHTLRERYHKQRWIIRLDEQVKVVSHFLECGNPACDQWAVIYRPPQEDTLALRGYTFGLDVVARIGELRYRDHLSITKIQAHLKTESQLVISLKEVALLCEVFLALVTTVACHDQALIEQLRMAGGIILAIDGVQPEKSYETLYILRDVCSGRVLVAKTLLSSATGEIEQLIDEVLGLGLPILGVISDKQESICLAVQHKLPTVPHQICQYHYLKDVAQPVCDRDRHFKKELKKRVRGIRDIERQAEQSANKEAQVVADYCIAVRTVMRDDGRYPLEPPGVKLYRQWQLIAASVERVMAAHPSALLKRLWRMLAVLSAFQQEFEQLEILFHWIHYIAHLLKSETGGEEAQAEVVAFVHGLQQSCPHAELLSLVAYVEKITLAFIPHLFEYIKQPLLPRTNNDLELFIGRLKKSRRHATGRKNTHAFILREGSMVAILFGLPPTDNWVDAFSRVDPNDFQQTLRLLRQTDKRSKCWRARHDLEAYLASLEQPWVSPEGVLQR
jgi:hypothetical protein